MDNTYIPPECIPKRADFAFTFICYAKLAGRCGLLTYDYNPVWQTWFPFYDDKNKTPLLHNFKGTTFNAITREHEKVLPVDKEFQIKKAKERFFELFGTSFEFEPLKTNSVVWELKFSKSQKLWTLYKIFNFIITKVKEPKKLLEPKGMSCKLISTEHIRETGLVTNVADIYDDIKQEAEKHVIII